MTQLEKESQIKMEAENKVARAAIKTMPAIQPSGYYDVYYAPSGLKFGDDTLLQTGWYYLWFGRLLGAFETDHYAAKALECCHGKQQAEVAKRASHFVTGLSVAEPTPAVAAEQEKEELNMQFDFQFKLPGCPGLPSDHYQDLFWIPPGASADSFYSAALDTGWYYVREGVTSFFGPFPTEAAAYGNASLTGSPLKPIEPVSATVTAEANREVSVKVEEVSVSVDEGGPPAKLIIGSPKFWECWYSTDANIRDRAISVVREVVQAYNAARIAFNTHNPAIWPATHLTPRPFVDVDMAWLDMSNKELAK